MASVKKARQRSRSKVRSKKVVTDANTLAHALTMNKTSDNIDLKASVAGYTHRGGFKLAINNIEQLTDTLVEQWKSKCKDHGYSCSVAYNASLSTAILHARSSATPVFQKEPDKKTFNVFRSVHPLTIAAAALFAINAGRHYFFTDI